jgi:hypothetical protein
LLAAAALSQIGESRFKKKINYLTRSVLTKLFKIVVQFSFRCGALDTKNNLRRLNHFCDNAPVQRMTVMEQHVVYIFIDYRGRHRKGVAIYSATSVNFQQKLWFH